MHMADTQFSHWLKWFTAETYDDDPSQYVFALPDGKYAATNGKIAAIENRFSGKLDALVGVTQKTINRIAKRREDLARMLTTTPIKSISLPRQQILAIFGPCEHPVMEPCDECGGAGETLHHCDCELCNVDTEDCKNCYGTGKAISTSDTRYASMWNHPIDANLAAYILAHAPECEEYKLFISEATNSWHLHIVTEKWHAIQVCLLESVLRKRECRELIPEDIACSPG